MNQSAALLELFLRNGFLIAGRLFNMAMRLPLLIILTYLTSNTPKEINQFSEATEKNQDNLAINIRIIPGPFLTLVNIFI